MQITFLDRVIKFLETIGEEVTFPYEQGELESVVSSELILFAEHLRIGRIAGGLDSILNSVRHRRGILERATALVSNSTISRLN